MPLFLLSEHAVVKFCAFPNYLCDNFINSVFIIVLKKCVNDSVRCSVAKREPFMLTIMYLTIMYNVEFLQQLDKIVSVHIPRI